MGGVPLLRHVAVGIDIAWGYGGMLVLGQGVFFGLGAYAMGMHLTLEQVEPGQLPSFMSLYGDQTELPLIWKPFEHLWFSVVLALLVPMAVAGCSAGSSSRGGSAARTSRCSTQATALVFSLILVGQLKTSAGTNGLTDFATVFGRNKYDPDTNTFLYFVAAGVLVVVFLVARHLVAAGTGGCCWPSATARTASRFLGYNPAVTKTFGFVVAAGMAGAAGAVAAPVIGIVAPNQFARPAVDPDGLLGGGRRPRHALRRRPRGGARRLGPHDVQRERPDTGSTCRASLFVVVVAFIPGGSSGSPG